MDPQTNETPPAVSTEPPAVPAPSEVEGSKAKPVFVLPATVPASHDPESAVRQLVTNALHRLIAKPSHINAAAAAGEIVSEVKRLLAGK